MAHTRILVVDDNDMARSVAQQMLMSLGYEAAVVDTGKRALVKFSEAPYDLILLDLYLPDMSGVRVFDVLREQEPNLKIVFMTGYSVREIDGMDYAAPLKLVSKRAAARGDAFTVRGNETGG